MSPWSYIWSTGSIDQSITGLYAGFYEVTVTDGNACTETAEVVIEEPPLMSLSLTVNEPDCFDQQKGVITILPLGGVEPFEYSIDGINFTSSNIFTGLNEGNYQITTRDAND